MEKNATWLRSTFGVLALGLVPVVAHGEAGRVEDAKAPAKEAPAPKDAHAAKYEELTKRLDAARKDFRAKLEAVKEDPAKHAELREKEAPDKAFLLEFQALAKAAKGTETAAKSLMQVLMLAGQTGGT